MFANEFGRVTDRRVIVEGRGGKRSPSRRDIPLTAISLIAYRRINHPIIGAALAVISVVEFAQGLLSLPIIILAISLFFLVGYHAIDLSLANGGTQRIHAGRFKTTAGSEFATALRRQLFQHPGDDAAFIAPSRLQPIPWPVALSGLLVAIAYLHSFSTATSGVKSAGCIDGSKSNAFCTGERMGGRTVEAIVNGPFWIAMLVLAVAVGFWVYQDNRTKQPDR